MFVLLAKIVGCCGISCKKLPHVVPNLQQCLPATFFGNAHAKDGVLQTTNTFPKNYTTPQCKFQDGLQNFPTICTIFFIGNIQHHPQRPKTQQKPHPCQAKHNSNQTRHIPCQAKHNPCPNCHTKHTANAHTTPHYFASRLWEGRSQPPCCPIVWQRTAKVLALRTAKFATRVWNLTTNHATPPNQHTTTGTLPSTLLCKHTTRRHKKSTKKTLGA